MNFYRRWGKWLIQLRIERAPTTFDEMIAETIKNGSIFYTVHSREDVYKDDPEAHAVVSGPRQSALDDPGYAYDPRPGASAYLHVGAQTATVTVEPLNMVNQRDEE